MDTQLESLVVSLRADTAPLTRGFAQLRDDLSGLKGLGDAVGGSLRAVGASGDDFADSVAAQGEQLTDRLGLAFERFARRGKLSFEGLKSAALGALSDIANSVIRSQLDNLFGGGGPGAAGGGNGGGWAGLVNAGLNILGSFAGRAVGGDVSEDRPYLVGERGPEVFVPQQAGRILPHGAAPVMGQNGGRPINITVNVAGSGHPAEVRQSAGQVALAVRRAVMRAERDS